MPDRNITFEIKEHLGTIGRYDTGWNKELNVISWNGATAKYDIREWDEYHTRMKRGITLSQWEMRKLVDLYLTRNNERAIARGKAIEAERNARKEAAFQNKSSVAETETEMETELVVTEDGEVVEPAGPSAEPEEPEESPTEPSVQTEEMTEPPTEAKEEIEASF